ncbi:hypothetical protein EDB84DRAFT_1440792 [Lactarius hengduanensis]|nr:hypothetical protein EDB84DRAFT_1440792 [Lactarius hengduanensis]
MSSRSRRKARLGRHYSAYRRCIWVTTGRTTRDDPGCSENVTSGGFLSRFRLPGYQVNTFPQNFGGQGDNFHGPSGAQGWGDPLRVSQGRPAYKPLRVTSSADSALIRAPRAPSRSTSIVPFTGP